MRVLVCFSVVVFTFLMSCDTSKLSETPKNQFLGTWKVVGSEKFEGLEIKIDQDKKGKFSGTVVKLNDDKLVRLFLDTGDLWISGIDRNSNFEFVLKEKRIASELFSLYDISTVSEKQVQFRGKNTIVLSKGGENAVYKRLP